MDILKGQFALFAIVILTAVVFLSYPALIRPFFIPRIDKVSKDSSQTQLLRRSKVHSYKPVTHIAFLKVHKACSSTIQNIFLRYGYKNNLTFVLPYKGATINMRYSVVINKTAYPPPPGASFDILCSHCLYNRTKFEMLLPNDTVYIGTVREPFKQFISMVNYDHHKAIFGLKASNPVRKFLKHPRKLSIRNKNQDIPTTNNRMSYDFGFPQELFTAYNETAVREYLQKLDREIDLVILTEYFDESIILLRRLLRWDLKDVLFVRLNKKKYHPILLSVGKEEEKLYKKWAKLDYALYDFFKRKHLLNIDNQSDDFHKELAYFRSIRLEIEEFCANNQIGTNESKQFRKTKWNDFFIFHETECEFMKKREIPFVKLFKHKQGYI